jgi:hypothetical protein
MSDSDSAIAPTPTSRALVFVQDIRSSSADLRENSSPGVWGINYSDENFIGKNGALRLKLREMSSLRRAAER